MGYTYTDFIVRGRSSKRITAPGDIGSAYVVLDPKTISEIGLHETNFTVDLTLADRR